MLLFGCFSYTNCCEDVPLVEFMFLVFTRMPGESYLRRLRSLLLYLSQLRISSANTALFVDSVSKEDASLYTAACALLTGVDKVTG